MRIIAADFDIVGIVAVGFGTVGIAIVVLAIGYILESTSTMNTANLANSAHSIGSLGFELEVFNSGIGSGYILASSVSTCTSIDIGHRPIG